MIVYPEQIKAILIHIEALNAVEKMTDESAPYLLPGLIEDNQGNKYGRLVDEIGGEWGWELPK